MTDGYAWDAKEVDNEFVMDPSMYGCYRYAQIMRWQGSYFLGVSIESLRSQDLAATRSEALLEELLRRGTEDV